MNLEKEIFQPDKIALHAAKEVNKTVKHLGRLRLHKGQKLFELNTITKWIDVIEIPDSVTDLSGNVRRKFVIKENCLYVTAINLKNAEKKFIKMLS